MYLPHRQNFAFDRLTLCRNASFFHVTITFCTRTFIQHAELKQCEKIWIPIGLFIGWSPRQVDQKPWVFSEQLQKHRGTKEKDGSAATFYPTGFFTAAYSLLSTNLAKRILVNDDTCMKEEILDERSAVELCVPFWILNCD